MGKRIPYATLKQMYDTLLEEHRQLQEIEQRVRGERNALDRRNDELLADLGQLNYNLMSDEQTIAYLRTDIANALTSKGQMKAALNFLRKTTQIVNDDAYIATIARMVASNPEVFGDTVSHGIDKNEILDLLREGKKIQAIKEWRMVTGVGLKEAKEAVEDLGRKHGI